MEEVLKWFRKHETQVVEVLVAPTKAKRPRVGPKGDPSPFLEEHEMCLAGRRGRPVIHKDVVLSSMLTKVPTKELIQTWLYTWIETVVPSGRYLNLYGNRSH